MYVVGKDVVSRTVFVASGRNHPALFTASAQLRAPSWIAGRPPEGLLKVWQELRDSPVSFQTPVLPAYSMHDMPALVFLQ